MLVYRDGLVRSIDTHLGPRVQLKDGMKALHGESPQGWTTGRQLLLAGEGGLRAA